MAKRTENHEDLSKFKNRLWKLMEEKNYKAARDLATLLYDEGLAVVNSKDDLYNSDDEKRKNAIGSIEKKINKHLSSDDMKNVQGEFINACAGLLFCSKNFWIAFCNACSVSLAAPFPTLTDRAIVFWVTSSCKVSTPFPVNCGYAHLLP